MLKFGVATLPAQYALFVQHPLCSVLEIDPGCMAHYHAAGRTLMFTALVKPDCS